MAKGKGGVIGVRAWLAEVSLGHHRPYGLSLATLLIIQVLWLDLGKSLKNALLNLKPYESSLEKSPDHLSGS